MQQIKDLRAEGNKLFNAKVRLTYLEMELKEGKNSVEIISIFATSLHIFPCSGTMMQ